MPRFVFARIGIGVFDVIYIRPFHITEKMTAQLAAPAVIIQQIEYKVIHDVIIYINIVNEMLKGNTRICRNSGSCW